MEKTRRAYSTPRLTIYGNVSKITRQAVGKEPGGGDGTEQWPYGKIPSGPDAMGGHSRS